MTNDRLLTPEEAEFLANENKSRPPEYYGDGLRIKFAAAALTGVMADPNAAMSANSIAKLCWALADAMISQMDQQPLETKE